VIRRTFIDIEAAPSKAYIWGLKTRYVPLDHIAEDGYILCFSAWTEGEDHIVFYSLWDHGHDAMIEAAWDILDQADHVVSFNGKSYDIPMLKTEFLVSRLGPPSPFHHTDLYLETKQFRTLSSSLKYYLRILGIQQKLDNSGMELWKGCMNGVKSCQKEMEEYNIRDVEVMPELYDILYPWMSNVPNETLYVEEVDGKLRCRCGSENLRFKGYKHTKVLSYKQHHCQDCGSYVRERYAEQSGKNRRKDVTTW